ncbi:MAG: hypothetical protein HY909_26585 [Deltaproteobacteria bacterium]|nr:hypothetical protein [Deltaproteobacteria bacterium]
MRTLALALCLLGCRRAPTEPSPRAPSAPPADAPAPLPPVAAQAARVALAATDGGVAAPGAAERLALPLPAGVDVVAVRLGERWAVGALERERVTVGLEGAERVLARWRDGGHAPSAQELARVVGAFAYHPWSVFVTREVVGTLADGGGPRVASGAVLSPRPGNTGESLTFGYQVPDGQAGAGLHVAHFNVTASGIILDEAPNPWRR